MKKIVYIYMLLLGLAVSACSEENDYKAELKDLVVVAVTPSSGSAGDIVTVLGRNFSTVKSENIVKFNGIEALVLEADKGKLQIVLPQIVEGIYPVEVTVGDSMIVGPRFTFQKSIDNGWLVVTVVGQNGIYAMQDGLGTEATCKLPTGLSYAPDGSIWFTDRGNNAIRRISADMEVTTIAGGLNAGMFNAPWQGNFDSKGNYYVADKANNRIQKIEAGTHNASTFATGFKSPMSLVFDKNDNMYVADRDNKAIRKIAQDGQATIFPLGMAPNCLTLDPHGNLIIGGSSTYTLIKLAPDGTVSQIAGDGSVGTAYFDGEPGNPMTAEIGQIFGITSDASGAIYIADASYHVIRKFTPAAGGDYTKGAIETIAGTGKKGTSDGKALSASFNTPYAILTSSDGKTLYVADAISYLIRRITLR